MDKLIRFFKEEEGATAVEYGVLVALIIAACVVIIGTLGTKLSSMFSKIETKITAPA